jgi:hypothetical protein
MAKEAKEGRKKSRMVGRAGPLYIQTVGLSTGAYTGGLCTVLASVVQRSGGNLRLTHISDCLMSRYHDIVQALQSLHSMSQPDTSRQTRN